MKLPCLLLIFSRLCLKLQYQSEINENLVKCAVKTTETSDFGNHCRYLDSTCAPPLHMPTNRRGNIFDPSNLLMKTLKLTLQLHFFDIHLNIFYRSCRCWFRKTSSFSSIQTDAGGTLSHLRAIINSRESIKEFQHTNY